MDTNAPNASSGAPDEKMNLNAPPERYIRTLAGDLATLKAGGKPDLAPLPEKPGESFVAAVAAAEKEAPSELDLGSSSLMPLLHKKASLPPPPSRPAPPPILKPAQLAPPPPPPPKPPEPKSSPVRTYAQDFSEHVKEEHASRATLLAAEQDAGKKPVATPPTGHRWRTIAYVAAGVVLLVAGVSGLYYGYTLFQKQTGPVIIAPTISAPIFVDEQMQISGTGAELAAAIAQSESKPLGDGGMRLLYLPNATSTDTTVFAELKPPAPDLFLRNINATGSMAGIVNADGGIQTPFFILSVASYSDTFAGLLSWEPSMERDLAELYPPYPASVAAATTTATSTAPADASTTPVNAAFRDQVVDNHDVRILKDANGRAVLLYGYWDQSTLVIARDAQAFTDIINRLASSRTAQ